MAMATNLIRRILYPEQEDDGEDGEDDQGLGDDAVHRLLPFMDVEDVRVSEKLVICAA